MRFKNFLRRAIAAGYIRRRAVVLVEIADPVHKISSIPRGRRVLDYSLRLHWEDVVLLSRADLVLPIRVKLGGGGAEELVLGDVSGRSRNDLEKSTALTPQVFRLYGMTDRIGRAN